MCFRLSSGSLLRLARPCAVSTGSRCFDLSVGPLAMPIASSHDDLTTLAFTHSHSGISVLSPYILARPKPPIPHGRMDAHPLAHTTVTLSHLCATPSTCTHAHLSSPICMQVHSYHHLSMSSKDHILRRSNHACSNCATDSILLCAMFIAAKFFIDFGLTFAGWGFRGGVMVLVPNIDCLFK